MPAWPRAQHWGLRGRRQAPIRCGPAVKGFLVELGKSRQASVETQCNAGRGGGGECGEGLSNRCRESRVEAVFHPWRKTFQHRHDLGRFLEDELESHFEKYL